MHRNILIVINVVTVALTLLILIDSLMHTVQDDEMARVMMMKFLFTTKETTPQPAGAKSAEASNVTLAICPSVRAVNKNAFVTYISSAERAQTHIKWYILSASKLAKSMRLWDLDADLILFLAEDHFNKVSAFDVGLLETSGWKICRVPFIQGKLRSRNHARTLTKMQAWKLVEYEGVAVLDADVLAKQNPRAVFQTEWKRLSENNCQLGVVAKPEVQPYLDWSGVCQASKTPFASGLYLLRPSLETYADLMEEVRLHDSELQLIQKLHRGCTLPSTYMMDLLTKYCHESAREPAIFQHFTTAKPWRTRDCEQWHIAEECREWAAL